MIANVKLFSMVFCIVAQSNRKSPFFSSQKVLIKKKRIKRKKVNLTKIYYILQKPSENLAVDQFLFLFLMLRAR